MTIYALPSFIALTIKLWLFYNSRRNIFNKHNKAIFSLLLSLFILNLFEFIQFNYIESSTGLILLKFYYLGAIFSVAAFFDVAVTLSSIRINVWNQYLLPVLLSLIVLFSDLLIADARSNGYAVTRIPGELYWLLQIYIVFGLTTSLFILIYSSLKLTNVMQRKRCTVILLSFLPTVLAAVSIVLWMHIGIQLNAAVILPLLVTFSLLVIIYTENNYHLFRLLTALPFTEERERYKKASSIIRELVSSAYMNHPMDLKQTMKDLEQEVVTAIVNGHGGNQSRAARQLGISKSTICRRFNGKCS